MTSYQCRKRHLTKFRGVRMCSGYGGAVIIVAVGGNENESCKEEIYCILACPREGFTRCHLRLRASIRFSQVAEDRRKGKP